MPLEAPITGGLKKCAAQKQGSRRSECQHLLAPAFNLSVRIEARDEELSGEAGAVFVHDILKRTGVLDRLVALHDPRDPRYLTHDLKSLLCTAVVPIAQGWRPGQGYHGGRRHSVATPPAGGIACAT